MRLLLTCFVLLGLAMSDLSCHAEDATRLYPEVADFLDARVAEFDQIPAGRRAELRQLTDYVAEQRAAAEPARMTFICTHNSRRSHLAQLWAAVGAARYGVEGVETFSGGTEATAFNQRAVAAVRRAGLRIEALSKAPSKAPAEADNPRYEVRFSDSAEPQTAFSKVYDESPNPTAGFCAVMTCTSADRACPTVAGAQLRVALPYEDPKVADNTQGEAAKYDDRCRQIAREMLFVFAELDAQLEAE